jgi:hypothetical protein
LEGGIRSVSRTVAAQHRELYCRGSLNCLRQLYGKSSMKKLFGFLAFERLDHRDTLSHKDIIVKGYYYRAAHILDAFP